MVCTPGLTLTLNKQSKISLSTESIWITRVTAAYANMTSQINNDKLQRGYSQRTHNLWPAVNFALICSLTQLIILSAKGWEWRSVPLLENYWNRMSFMTILEHHLPMKEQISCCLSLHTAWRESSNSCHAQNNVTTAICQFWNYCKKPQTWALEEPKAFGRMNYWEKSLKARDLHFSFLIRLWKAFASHKTLLRMSPRAVGWDTTSLSYMNSCARSRSYHRALVRAIRQDEPTSCCHRTDEIVSTYEHMNLAHGGSFHVINKARSMSSDRFIV